MSSSTAPEGAAAAAAAGLTRPSLQYWRASIYVLLLTGLILALSRLFRRPPFPKNAPRLMTADSWPVLGVLRFFSDRKSFFLESVAEATAASPGGGSGYFSFFFGSHHIVGLTGLEGRKAFFESRELNMSEGYSVLFTTTPSVKGSKVHTPGEAAPNSVWFARTITKMLKKENFVKNLPVLVSDTQARLQEIVDRNHGSSTGIIEPFDDLYRVVYQLTMRTVGATEIAESPELLDKTLSLFGQIEKSNSPARIIFPWLPTPNHLRRMAAGARLYVIFNGIIEARKKAGRRLDDALQFLMDTGEDVVKILSFVLGALFAGQLNSGINAAYLVVHLATTPEWYRRVRAEVDASVSRHRTSPAQTPAEILATLTIDDWESEFPLVDLCLRECIRFLLPGTAFRRNISGRDVPIGSSSDEIIPRDAFAIYSLDDVHMNPEVYTEPARWDPARYLPGRAEDKRVPLAYLGWGAGRHPCLGMRFARLEMAIIAALFVAMFDFELVDDEGARVHEAPVIDRSRHSAGKPDKPCRLRYTLRKY